MRARTLLLLFVALVLAVGTAMLARSWLATERTREIATVAPPPPKPVRSVLVARANIARGQILKPEDMIWQAWPDGSLDKNYIVSGTGTLPQKFAGWVAINPIAGGEPITPARIVAPGNSGYLAAVLKPGMRAVTVPVTLTTAGSGLIFPGDRVDLISTYLVPPPQGVQGRGNQVAETVLRNVRVISMDATLQATPGTPIQRPQNVTFEVTPKQAEIIAVANEFGKITLSLDSITSTAPETGSSAPDQSEDSPSSPHADSPVANTASYTVDSQISGMMPNAATTVTILRGSAKTRESVDWSQFVGGGQNAAKSAGGT